MVTVALGRCRWVATQQGIDRQPVCGISLITLTVIFDLTPELSPPPSLFVPGMPHACPIGSVFSRLILVLWRTLPCALSISFPVSKSRTVVSPVRPQVCYFPSRTLEISVLPHRHATEVPSYAYSATTSAVTCATVAYGARNLLPPGCPLPLRRSRPVPVRSRVSRHVVPVVMGHVGGV